MLRECNRKLTSSSAWLLGALLTGPACVLPAAAQLPGTDIWLAELRIGADAVEIVQPVNATNRPGYDNQPFFLPDGSGFLYSSGDSASGTDVWRRDAAGTAPVTRTAESEYSPTPFSDGSGFCAVRVESNGAQRLWRFDADGGNPRPVMTDVDSVGYYEWIDDATLAVFVVGEPHTLRIVDVPTQRETVVARGIGRFIRCVPGTRDVTFTLGDGEGVHRFVRLPSGAAVTTPLIEGVGGEDAVWAGEVLLATGADGIFAARPLRGGGWTRVADLDALGLAGATRLAVDPGHTRLAVVCAE